MKWQGDRDPETGTLRSYLCTFRTRAGRLRFAFAVPTAEGFHLRLFNSEIKLRQDGPDVEGAWFSRAKQPGPAQKAANQQIGRWK